jgi:hypothetical protein
MGNSSCLLGTAPIFEKGLLMSSGLSSSSGFRLQAASALAYLAVIAILGGVLRYSFVGNIGGINFKFLLHAHSHTALLGWIHAAICALLIRHFIPGKSGITYKLQFWGMQICVLGMLLSFPFQGYGSVSIPFSIAHIFISYWFAFCFYFDTRKQSRQNLPLKFVYTGLIFMILGTAGPFSLGPIMSMGLGEKLYFSAIYYYLHFLYNGWFTFAAIGIFFNFLRKTGIEYSKEKALLSFRLFALACIPAFALSVLWTKPATWIYIIGFTASGLQLAALGFLIRLALPLWPQLKAKTTFLVRILLVVSFSSLCLKLALQFISAFPYFADLAYILKNFIIGYLHLVLLGFLTPVLFAFFLSDHMLPNNRTSRLGFLTFFTGFILSESLLCCDGILAWLYHGSIPNFHTILFAVSILLPVGAIMILLSALRQSRVNANNQLAP